MLDANASHQEIFDFVVKKLFEQGEPSMVIIGSRGEGNIPVCVYLSPEGLKCAVGMLIPADKYKPEIDTDSLIASRIVGKIDVPVINDKNAAFLDSLQEVHDAWDKGSNALFVQNLQEFCNHWKLDSAVLYSTPINGVTYER